MGNKPKLIIIVIIVAICIYLISLIEDKLIQLLLGFGLMIVSLSILLYLRKRE